jgi:hypothetical protein
VPRAKRSKLLLAFCKCSLRKVAFQIHCTVFGRKSMIGGGKSLWNCQNYMMALLLRMFLPSKPKFKSSGICFLCVLHLTLASIIFKWKYLFTLHNHVCFCILIFLMEKTDRPFRCLDGQYRRELIRVYLSNVEQICRRFIDERRSKLSRLIADKLGWSRLDKLLNCMLVF